MTEPSEIFQKRLMTSPTIKPAPLGRTTAPVSKPAVVEQYEILPRDHGFKKQPGRRVKWWCVCFAPN